MSGADQATRLLQAASAKEADAADTLLPLVYDELRRLAQYYLARERPDHTLQATALVHEAYLKLIDQTRAEWKDRAHFFAIAAQAMRRVLVDHARRKKRLRRGGGVTPIDLDHAITVSAADVPMLDVIALDQSLTRLTEHAPEKARVLELKLFAGVPDEEIAEVLNVTPRSVRRYCQYAQAWLYRDMQGESSRSSNDSPSE